MTWFAAIASCTLVASISAQNEPKHVKVPIVEARPEVVSSPEAIVKASFETESGPVGTPRDPAGEQTLYDPAGLSVAAGPELGSYSLRPWATHFRSTSTRWTNTR